MNSTISITNILYFGFMEVKAIIFGATGMIGQGVINVVLYGSDKQTLENKDIIELANHAKKY